MNILDKIIAQKRKEIEANKEIVSLKELEKSVYFNRTCISLSQRLLADNSTGIIAEFKRKSPSKGWINEQANIAEITKGYEVAGAAGLSILTDTEFFGGKAEDIISQRKNLAIPILRKDFIIDAYQLAEAKAMGADVILLIAACLTPAEVKELAKAAHNYGLEVLLEIHNEDELQHICEEVDMVGINNRNLKTFEVDIETSIRLLHALPANKPAIAESGIGDVAMFKTLRSAGFKGFLMGEYFMKQQDPAAAIKAFVKEINE